MSKENSDRGARHDGDGSSSNSAIDQRTAILRALRVGPRTSYDLRRLDSYQCTTRIFDLRKLGHAIKTTRVTVIDRDGFWHPGVAIYSIAPEPGAALAPSSSNVGLP